MQIENISLLSMQNTYITKEISVSSRTNQASPENERSSSIPDAGPAAVFEKGGATNGMTETVGISRVASMGSAGMLYSAGIMPMALNSTVNEPGNGMNIDGITTLKNEPGGSMIGATWSAIMNPENVCDGSVISVNGIKFEFDDNDNTQADADIVTVDIKNLSNAADIAQRFVDAVNNDTNAKKIAQSIYGVETLPDPIDLTGLCSWSKVNNNWTLQFTQSSSWAREGDAFEVETGSVIQTTNVTIEKAKKEAAYLEYEVDINQLQHGDYFRFRDMCFIFKKSDASVPNIPLDDKVNPVYIDISRGNATTDEDFANKFKNNFTNQFKTYFAPTQSGSVASRGESNGSVSYSSRSPIKRYSSDKFNISLDFLANGKLRIKITATGLNFLEKIALTENEGWGRSVEGEEPGQPDEGTESTNPEEGTQGDTGESTASVPDSSAPTDSSDPAASSQSETDNVSSAESNGNNEPNKVEDAEVVSVNNTENTDNKIEGAESPDAETSDTETQETSEPTTTEKTEEKAENSETQEVLDLEN